MGLEPIRILMVDDHAIVRNGMRLMLSVVEALQVCGEADTAQQALQMAREGQFDLVLLDIGLPDCNGLELIKRLREQNPQLPILVLSMYAEDVYAIRAFKLGAGGYLTKNCSTDNLLAAIRKVAAGGVYLSSAVMEKFAAMLGGGVGAAHECLSDRELDVLKQLAAGHSLVAIGKHLHLSPTTVSAYRTRVLDKMGMRSNAQLIRYVLEHGLLI